MLCVHSINMINELINCNCDFYKNNNHQKENFLNLNDLREEQKINFDAWKN